MRIIIKSFNTTTSERGRPFSFFCASTPFACLWPTLIISILRILTHKNNSGTRVPACVFPRAAHSAARPGPSGGHRVLLESQQMFLSITDFQEPGVSRRELGWQPQGKGRKPRRAFQASLTNTTSRDPGPHCNWSVATCQRLPPCKTRGAQLFCVSPRTRAGR